MQTLNSILQQSIIDNNIKNEDYTLYNVKKGLRNEDQTGVLVGLTRIADVVGYEKVGSQKVDCEGRLYYRGYEIHDLISQLDFKHHQGFEQCSFLLLFGHLPNEEELNLFRTFYQENLTLPKDFLELNILRMPGKNLMNKIQQAILMLYAYDDHADDVTPYNTLIQGLGLLAKMPSIIAYSYQTKIHNYDDKSLIIHKVKKENTIAETILRLTRKDKKYTDTEAEVLDCMLVLHADHGGGNNSTFTNVVISSTGTDLYSSMAGSVGALKGPRHGGANLKVSEMMQAVIQEIGYNEDEKKIKDIIQKILNKEFFDQKGLVYGMGHAVYTLSDPRSKILQEYASRLASEKGMEKEFAFYQRFEKCASEVIYENKKKHVSSNVDFYSGFVYEMLNIPMELASPLFVCARLVGWLAHNIEDKCYCNKIIRPATKYVKEKE
ncbi:MAG: citrate synthase [Traorella sp.]